MQNIYYDKETKVVEEQFALIYAPKKKRGRYPENCVQIMESEEQALESADPEKNLYPARVVGPSRSSEGLRLYYLMHWLDAE